MIWKAINFYSILLVVWTFLSLSIRMIAPSFNGQLSSFVFLMVPHISGKSYSDQNLNCYLSHTSPLRLFITNCFF